MRDRTVSDQVKVHTRNRTDQGGWSTWWVARRMYWSNDEVKKGDGRSMHGTCCGQKTVTADPGKWIAVELRSMWCLGDDGQHIWAPE
jgi:hypothetical protein